MTPCPLCGRAPAPFLDAGAVAGEMALRERFFLAGLRGRVSRDDLRDVTEVFRAMPAAILRCERCGVLVRDEAADDDDFRDDRYSAALLQSLHTAHAAAFRRKRGDYASLLPRRARVVEVGSYAGGFLRAASEWGWNVSGVDIGCDTARFTNALGYETRDALAAGTGTLDALFVWNCFEQLAAPRALLAAAFRALTGDGMLVLRVPDAEVYVACRDERILGANGLLGWPHRFGFGVAALRRLAEEHGFALQRVLRRPPLRREWTARSMRAGLCGWIELTFRKAAERRRFAA